MAEKAVKYCFFDFDGTLGDTFNGIRNAWLQTIAENGMECPEFDRIFRVGPPVEMMVKQLFPDEPETVWAELCRCYKYCYDNSDQAGEKPYPWSRDILELCRNSNMKLYVVTYKRFKSTLTLIDRYGFSGFFDGVFCTDLLPGQVWPKKDLLQIALRVSGASPDECIMIGDTEMDMQAGKAVGVRTLAVSWGYGSGDSLAACNPDFIVGNYDEFRKLFLEKLC